MKISNRQELLQIQSNNLSNNIYEDFANLEKNVFQNHILL